MGEFYSLGRFTPINRPVQHSCVKDYTNNCVNGLLEFSRKAARVLIALGVNRGAPLERPKDQGMVAIAAAQRDLSQLLLPVYNRHRLPLPHRRCPVPEALQQRVVRLDIDFAPALDIVFEAPR